MPPAQASDLPYEDSDPSSEAPFHPDDFFGAQPTPSTQLPPPELLLENLARCLFEVLSGARELDQVARWVSADVYRHLHRRVTYATMARTATKQPVSRPSFRVGSIHCYEPRDGVVEGTVVLLGKARARAVAIRLEGMDSRWRATAVHIL
jgi:hypothetical protein